MAQKDEKPVRTQPPDPLRTDSGSTGTKPPKQQMSGSEPSEEEEEEEE